MYCDKNNFIYVHIPKTAGSTVEYLLMPHVSEKIQITFRPERERAWEDDVELHVSQRGQHHTKHWTLTEHVQHCMLEDKVDDIFKFTIVRNPYERMLKLFLFKLQNGEFKPSANEPGYDESQKLYRGKHITDAVLADWRDHMFTDFLEGTRNVKQMGVRTFFGAYQMCVWDNKVQMDHIMRYENFAEDLDELFNKLDLPPAVDIPVTNSTRAVDEETLKNFYNDHNRKIIETRYIADFEHFGYETWK